MRLVVMVLVVTLGLAAAAHAQTSITLAADPVPIIDAQINGRPVRLEVDLRFPDALALSRDAARRLHVFQVPIAGVRVGIEGSDAYLRGRIARPRVVFGDRELSSRAFAGVFGVPVTSRADGVIGPGALPYDTITIMLGPEPALARDIVLNLQDADEWSPRVHVGNQDLLIWFNPGNPASIFNRPASRAFDASGAVRSSGDVSAIPLILGLSTMMQPVDTDLTMQGLPIRPAFARTNAPLLGAEEEDAVVVTGRNGDPPPPSLSLGRDALAGCAYIRVDRRARTLTLRCAG